MTRGRFLVHLAYVLFIILGILTAELARHPLTKLPEFDPLTVINLLPVVAPPAVGAFAVKALLDSRGLLTEDITTAGMVVCFQNGLSWRAAATAVGH